MIAVIQCAARKNANAGTLRTSAGQPVCFVANPALAPNDRYAYARPDGFSESGESWRNRLLRYNHEDHGNSLGLLPAYRLYLGSARAMTLAIWPLAWFCAATWPVLSPPLTFETVGMGF